MYYLHCDGETIGPYSAAEVRERLARGAITPSDYVWTEGMEDWAFLGETDAFRLRKPIDPRPRKPSSRPVAVAPRKAARRKLHPPAPLPSAKPTDPRKFVFAALFFLALLALYFAVVQSTKFSLDPLYRPGVEMIFRGPVETGREEDRLVAIALLLVTLSVGGIWLWRMKRKDVANE